MKRFDKFDKKFQSYIVATVIKSYRAAVHILPMIKPDYFEFDGDREIISLLKKYYKKHRMVPSPETIRQKIDSDYHKYLNRILKKKVKDIDIVIEEVTEFKKYEDTKYAFMRSIELIEDGKLDEIKPIMRSLFSDRPIVGGSAGGFLKGDLFKNLKEGLTDANKGAVPTGFYHLDRNMEGGLHGGELGVVMGRLKLGKSFWLLNVAYNAITSLAGKKVVHYTLENSYWRTIRRYYRRLTHDEDITFESHKMIQSRFNKYIPGEIYVQQFPTKRATVSDLYSHLDWLIDQNSFKPDLVVVDYADLLKPERTFNDRRFELGSIFEDLRGLAMEFEIPLWTATQTRRVGHRKRLVDADDTSESYEKPQIADVFLTLSRTEEEWSEGTIRMYLAAMRDSPGDKVIFLNTDYSKALMRSFQEVENYELLMSEADDASRMKKGKRARRKYGKFEQRKLKKTLHDTE